MIQEEKLEEAKRLYQTANADQRYVLESLFPELAESEDERIEKEIIAFLKENLETGRADETWSLSGLKRWIAWLEKQALKPKWSEEDDSYKLFAISAVKDYYDGENPLHKNLVEWLKSLKERMEK